MADKLFVEVSDKLHNSPALILTKMLIWNKKDNVSCFFFVAHLSHWVVPEKIHTPPTDGILEILAGGGVEDSGNPGGRGG